MPNTTRFRMRGIWSLILLLILLTACGGGTTERVTNMPDNPNVTPGETLFAQPVLGDGNLAVMGCASCHATDPAAGDGVGPNLAGVATRAATRDPNMTAAEYLRASIVDPHAFVVEGFDAGAEVKPQNYGEILSAQELTDLVAYLQTLE